MPCSLVVTNLSEECTASIFKMLKIMVESSSEREDSELGGSKHFPNLILYVCICRGGFPHALRPYMVYCTSPMDIHTAAMPTHRASPLVPPTREQWN
jgi:hypothetical protein